MEERLLLLVQRKDWKKGVDKIQPKVSPRGLENAKAAGRHQQELGDFSTTLRVLPISALAVVIGAICAFVALALLRLIGLFTNVFYFGRWSSALVRSGVGMNLVATGPVTPPLACAPWHGTQKVW